MLRRASSGGFFDKRKSQSHLPRLQVRDLLSFRRLENLETGQYESVLKRGIDELGLSLGDVDDFRRICAVA